MHTYRILRAGAALCFIGHGAFGIITKAAWVPYFEVAGIPEAWAWALMPLVGAIDITAGMVVLFAPRGAALAYMILWAWWTALLRPLAGESVFETLERAGNYGVPLAFVALTGLPRSRAWLWQRLDAPARDANSLETTAAILKWTTALLLLGHGALGAIVHKGLLSEHYASIGIGGLATPVVGVFEMVLAVAVLLRPSVPLLGFITAWKLATESLFFTSGAPVWEFVERAGSYAAPLALLLLRSARAGEARPTFARLNPTADYDVHSCQSP